MKTYTVEGHITKIVTMNIAAASPKEALLQAETYMQNGAYIAHKTEYKIVSIA